MTHFDTVWPLGTIREIITGTWLVALHVVGLKPLEHPGIVRIPIGERTPVSRGMAGYIITVSPGTFAFTSNSLRW